MSKIILLNGCGSSGKSSIAKSFQHLSEQPWLHVGMDMLIDMMPEQFIGFGREQMSAISLLCPGIMRLVLPCVLKPRKKGCRYLAVCHFLSKC